MPMDGSKPGLTKCLPNPITNITEDMFRELKENMKVSSALENTLGISDVAMTGLNVIIGIVNAFAWKFLHREKKKLEKRSILKRSGTIGSVRRKRGSVFFVENNANV